MNDSLIIAEFDDMMSGRIPNYPEIIAKYPKLQKDQHYWKQPLKEGGNVDDFDEFHMRIGTIYKNKVFYKEYEWKWYEQNFEQIDMEVWIENILKERVRGNVEKFLSTEKGT